MRFGELRSIAHNIADSLASGYTQLVGLYELNVFDEAAANPQGFIEVDFLTGTTTGSPVSATLGGAIIRFREALPSLCRKHHVSETVFTSFKRATAAEDCQQSLSLQFRTFMVEQR